MHDSALAGCYVISLRPAGQHEPLRSAAVARGARLLALSPWKIAVNADAATRDCVRDALACATIVATSPNAVSAAVALQPLRARGGQQWLAVGEGTAHALTRAGIAQVAVPARMDSEGLLALPALQDLRDRDVGLLTAPGGRGLIEAELQRRGARVVRADVYARVPITIPSRSIAALRQLRAPAWLALSSGEALACVLAQLPSDAAAILRRARVAAASARLAEVARGHGFDGVVLAASARPRDLVAAMADDASASMRGIASPGPIP
jgi:uroporphyrinogen-III synthase